MTRKKVFIVFVPLVLVLVALDRITKMWAASALSSAVAATSTAAKTAQSYNFGLIDFTLVHNTGAAFGIGAQSTWLFIILASAIVLGIIIYLCFVKNVKLGFVVALSLLAAGGIGNVIDRVIFGYVIDFIEFSFFDFPVFNVADICVTCGVVLLFIYVLFFGTTAKKSKPTSGCSKRE